MKKSLLFVAFLICVYSIQVTLFSKRPQEKDFFSTKKQRVLQQPTFGSPEFLYLSKTLDLKESYLKIILDLTAFPNLFKEASKIDQVLSFQLVSANHKKYSLFLSNLLPAFYEKNQFTGYFGIAHEVTIPVGLYSLEVHLKNLWSEPERIGYQPNSVMVEEVTPSKEYSFLVLQGLNFAANHKEAQIFQNFLAFLQNPSPALTYSSFLPSSSLTSKMVLYSQNNPTMRDEYFQKTLKRLQEAKFVVVLGGLVQSENEPCGGLFSKQNLSTYQKNYEQFYEALKKSKKPFFLVPGDQESRILPKTRGQAGFDGQKFFETYFAPLNHWISYQGNTFAFLNSYDHAPENRQLSPNAPRHEGGRITKETLSWLKQLPSNTAQFLFLACDPRGGSTENIYPFTTQNFGDLEDWEDREPPSSWMKPRFGDERIAFLQHLSQLHQSSVFFGKSSQFMSNEIEGGENLIGWKDIEDWKKYNLGPRYFDNFIMGTLLVELYYFVPRVLILERLSEFDPHISKWYASLTTTNLNQFRLGLPGIKGADSAFITDFMIALEARIQQMGPTQLRRLLENPREMDGYFAKKAEFMELFRHIRGYRKTLEEYQRLNPKIGSGLLSWQQGNSRFFLDSEEVEAHKKIQRIVLKEKLPEQRVAQRNTLSLSNIPPFCSTKDASNQFILVTVQDNQLELQPLKFYFEESFFCYMIVLLLILLELFYFQWTRSLWEGLIIAFLETWKDFFGGESSR